MDYGCAFFLLTFSLVFGVSAATITEFYEGQIIFAGQHTIDYEATHVRPRDIWLDIYPDYQMAPPTDAMMNGYHVLGFSAVNADYVTEDNTSKYLVMFPEAPVNYDDYSDTYGESFSDVKCYVVYDMWTYSSGSSYGLWDEDLPAPPDYYQAVCLYALGYVPDGEVVMPDEEPRLEDDGPTAHFADNGEDFWKFWRKAARLIRSAQGKTVTLTVPDTIDASVMPTFILTALRESCGALNVTADGLCYGLQSEKLPNINPIISEIPFASMTDYVK